VSDARPDAQLRAARSARERLTLLAAPLENQREALARDVASGLTQQPKFIPCRYFYDLEGSHLFEEICRLPEYYLTRAERQILLAHADELVSLCVPNVTVVELGSGSAEKTQILLEAFLKRRGHQRYVCVDIARAMLEQSSLALLERHPTLEILAIADEYQHGLATIAERVREPKLLLWLGSNVGNFHRPDAVRFLARVRDAMVPRDLLLVGIDLRKDRRSLERAYDDAAGVTARFNKNILARINRELRGHFDLDAFDHRAIYDEPMGCVRMYLVSQRAQRVRIDALPLEISLSAGEMIHTEDTYKYSLEEIDQLGRAAHLGLVQQWFDPERRFSVNVFTAV
jgi:dimethylhistidine N-methyltransferase